MKFRRKCREALAAKVNWDAVKCVAICGNGGKDFLAWLRSDGLGTDLGAAATDAGVPALKKHVAGGAFCVAGPQIKETHKDALRVLLKEPAGDGMPRTATLLESVFGPEVTVPFAVEARGVRDYKPPAAAG